MKSKTKILKQMQKKRNPDLVKTILMCKKNEKWIELASILSGPSKKRIEINLDKINQKAKDNNTIVIPGKVLSQGEIRKKIKIVALNFSKKAEKKLLDSNTEFLKIVDEIKLNPDAKGVKIIK